MEYGRGYPSDSLVSCCFIIVQYEVGSRQPVGGV